jgi:hypothetical protein
MPTETISQVNWLRKTDQLEGSQKEGGREKFTRHSRHPPEENACLAQLKNSGHELKF